MILDFNYYYSNLSHEIYDIHSKNIVIKLRTKQPKLLDQVRIAIRTRHYSNRTEKSYINWIKRYIMFHGTRHPSELHESHLQHYLEHLAVIRNVAASTQNQALNAILFLYKHVLKAPLKTELKIVRAKQSDHIPVVFTKSEIINLIKKNKFNNGAHLAAFYKYLSLNIVKNIKNSK